VFAVFNFSAEPQTVTFEENLFHGKYTEYMSRDAVDLSSATQIELAPWDYRIFVK
jgi:hypothetical protein